MKLKRSDFGQAVVEYLILFALTSLIGINFVKGIGKMVGDQAGSLGYVLSEELAVGVCKRHCFFDGYANQGAP